MEDARTEDGGRRAVTPGTTAYQRRRLCIAVSNITDLRTDALPAGPGSLGPAHTHLSSLGSLPTYMELLGLLNSARLIWTPAADSCGLTKPVQTRSEPLGSNSGPPGRAHADLSGYYTGGRAVKTARRRV